MRITAVCILLSALLGAYGANETSDGSPLSARSFGNMPWQLPDWSRAGYDAGASLPREFGTIFDVASYGAKPDDTDDDTEAIQAALKAATDANGGTIRFPAGRFILSRPLNIFSSNIVIEGAGKGETIIYIPLPLSVAIRAQWMDKYGESIYTWNNAFIRFWGPNPLTGINPDSSTLLSSIVEDTPRGAYQVQVKSPNRFKVGDWVWLFQSDVKSGSGRGSLPAEMYGNFQNDKCTNKCYTGISGRQNMIRWSSKVKAIVGNSITLERPLPIKASPAWNAQFHNLRAGTHYVEQVGIEDLTIEFKLMRMNPHHKEAGYNAIEFNGAVNSWAKNVEVLNSDQAFLVQNSNFVSVDGCDVQATGERRHRSTNVQGHFAFGVAYSSDVRVSNFKVLSPYLHDMSIVKHSIQCVFHKGKGVDMNIDGHRGANYATLFSDLDMGKGERIFTSGGVGNRGFPVGAYTTFWNLRKSDWGVIPIRDATFLGPCTYGGNYLTYNGNFKETRDCPNMYVDRTQWSDPADLYDYQLNQKRK